MEQINITPAQLLALAAALENQNLHKALDNQPDEDKVSKTSVNYRPGEMCGNCSMYVDPHACTLVSGTISPTDICDKWESRGAQKSAETPSLLATPDILGPHGLWHTPSKKVPTKQKLPNYIEHIADALMRAGHSEQEAIAYAVNAVKRWSRGELGWGKRKVTPTVQAAAKKTLEEWEKLKASHKSLVSEVSVWSPCHPAFRHVRR